MRLQAPGMQARLHVGDEGTYLWVVNSNRSPQRAAVTLPAAFGLGKTYGAAARSRSPAGICESKLATAM